MVVSDLPEALLQSLLRNPLASPYLLGVSSSGAGLGVMAAMAIACFGGHDVGRETVDWSIPAMIGAVGALGRGACPWQKAMAGRIQ